MRRQFRDTVLDLAAHDDNVIVMVGDISHYMFSDFQEKYPTRFFNMGICENALVSVAAGLSSQGFYPFVHTIAPFVTERCLEQIKDDMCYNAFGGNILSCGASFDYAWDGATHHCYTDLAILRLLPGIEVVQPGSRQELDTLLRSQYRNGKPTYFRLSEHPHDIDLPVQFGRGTVLQDCGAKVTVMTAGPILGNVLEACRGLAVNLVNFCTIKPIDQEVIRRFKHTKILVVHDAFGLYEAICEVPNLSVSYHGLPDRFCTWYGTVPDIRQQIGLDSAAIRETVRACLEAEK
ncbi:Apulose-4-phosphate transketolase subunit B [Candidatus Entotheonellaceae bacterium PAL068K]